MFAIEKNIPQPKYTGGRKAKYPWKDMEVGDSFFVPCPEDERSKRRSSICASGISALGKSKVSTAIVDGGIRVWRIK